MGQMFNVKIIYNILKIEEKMLDSIIKISNYRDFCDIDYYSSELEKIMLYYKKENYLVSKIPDDIDFYDYLFEMLNNSSFDLKNESIIFSRFRNILYNNYVNLQQKYDFVDCIDDDYYDDEMGEFRAKLFIRDNLLTEYIKSFDEPMKSCDKKSYDIFNKIRLYNIFLNKNLFDFWVKSNFNFNIVGFCSVEEAINYLSLTRNDYYYLLNDTISELCVSLLTGIFSDTKNPKSNIKIQDSFFNFKFLLKKLSTKSVLAIKKEMDDLYSSIGKYGLLSDIIKMLDYELSDRDDVVDDDIEENDVDSTVFDKIISVVKLENILYDLYDEIDFNSSLNDLKKLSEFILLEKELVKDINFSSSLLTILNDLFNNNIWIYLTGDVSEKSSIIFQRITNLLPFYKDLKITPSQSIDSYEFIYKNHLIRSLRDLWELRNESNDLTIKKGFERIYKFYYFVNPELTDELVALNGNHTMIFDLSDDLSGFDNLEYTYDQDEQLFDLGCDIISFIFDNENKIDTVLDYSEFQFKINELMDIISILSDSYNLKLYRYLMDYSSFFSPLRRDIRKIFKEQLGKSKVKSISI